MLKDYRIIMLRRKKVCLDFSPLRREIKSSGSISNAAENINDNLLDPSLITGPAKAADKISVSSIGICGGERFSLRAFERGEIIGGNGRGPSG